MRTNTRAQRTRNKAILRVNDTCAVCGHRGANAIDHRKPLARGGTDQRDNLQPIHHGPCPTCGHDCNREKGAKDLPPIMRRSRSLA